MEEDTEEAEEDVQREDRPVVLWKKSIQQSIFVDLSEDESIHLSDLDSSLALQLSQRAPSEHSVHLSGSEDLSKLDNCLSESSSGNSNRTGSEKRNSNKPPPNLYMVKGGSPIKHRHEDFGQNTSDEEQDDLPYDGDLGNEYFINEASSEDSSEERCMADKNQEFPRLLELTQKDANKGKTKGAGAGFTNINHLLLQHLSQEDLLESSKFIRYETLPEVSLLESVDDSGLSSGQRCKDLANFQMRAENFAGSHLLCQQLSNKESLESRRFIEAEALSGASLQNSMNNSVLSSMPMRCHLDTLSKQEERHAANHAQQNIFHGELLQSSKFIEVGTLPDVFMAGSVSGQNSEATPSEAASQNSQATQCDEKRLKKVKSKTERSKMITEWEIHHSKSNAADRDALICVISNTSNANVSVGQVMQHNKELYEQTQRDPLVRTRSFGEIKYGQGQVSYPLPDFSKIAPKVKIPKVPSGHVRSDPNSLKTIHKTQSSPEILNVISRVLEDFIPAADKPYVFKDNDPQTAAAQPLQVKDKFEQIFSERAEERSEKDQVTQGTNTSFEFQPNATYARSVGCDGTKDMVEFAEAHLLPTGNACEQNKENTNANNNNFQNSTDAEIPPAGDMSDGDRMTVELRDILSHFMEKVEDFKLSVSNMTISPNEQQMILRSFMETQDQLERKYICKKEEHRALEMQNFMGLSRNIGKFDPNRQVEGDIFRIGMHLEDIKEKIDKNVYEQFSTPSATSTPVTGSPYTSSAHCMVTLTTPPPLDWEEIAGCPMASFEVETQLGEGRHTKTKNSSEVRANHVLNQSGTTLPENSGPTTSCERDFAERGDVQKRKKAIGHPRGVDFPGVKDDDENFAYLSGRVSTSAQWENNSDLNSHRDRGDSISLSAPLFPDTLGHSLSQDISAPTLSTSKIQSLASPEMDSGFGSSYLNTSTSAGSNLPFEREGEITPDSEGFGSNPPTTIESAPLTDLQWTAHPQHVQTQQCSSKSASERWSKSHKRSDRRQFHQVSHHRSDPVLQTAMDYRDRSSQMQSSCACNNEVLEALQSEVSRLKKDLEEGLDQLPHLAKKMNYLSSKYEQEDQESKSGAFSVQMGPTRRVKESSRKASTPCNININSSKSRTEEWFSSDMDPKSMGTDSLNCSAIEMQLQASPLGSRRAKEKAYLGSEFEDKLQIAKESRRAAAKSISTKEKWSHLSPLPLEKPLLQVNYSSSSSLPPSFRIREAQMQPVPRERSTQSDTDLLPSDVYFIQTPSAMLASPRSPGRTNRHRKRKEEDLSKSLDRAIAVASHMKKTADHMAWKISSELVRAQRYRRRGTTQPAGGRKHQGL